jgi:hypothetical protein
LEDFAIIKSLAVNTPVDGVVVRVRDRDVIVERQWLRTFGNYLGLEVDHCGLKEESRLHTNSSHSAPEGTHLSHSGEPEREHEIPWIFNVGRSVLELQAERALLRLKADLHMPVLLLVIGALVFVHIILVERVLGVVWIDVLAISVGRILLNRHHNLAHNVVVLRLCRQNDLELWMLSNVENELCRDIRGVVDSQWQCLGVSDSDAPKVELCLLYVDIRDLSTSPNWEL